MGCAFGKKRPTDKHSNQLSRDHDARNINGTNLNVSSAPRISIHSYYENDNHISQENRANAAIHQINQVISSCTIHPSDAAWLHEKVRRDGIAPFVQTYNNPITFPSFNPSRTRDILRSNIPDVIPHPRRRQNPINNESYLTTRQRVRGISNPRFNRSNPWNTTEATNYIPSRSVIYRLPRNVTTVPSLSPISISSTSYSPILHSVDQTLYLRPPSTRKAAIVARERIRRIYYEGG